MSKAADPQQAKMEEETPTEPAITVFFYFLHRVTKIWSKKSNT